MNPLFRSNKPDEIVTGLDVDIINEVAEVLKFKPQYRLFRVTGFKGKRIVGRSAQVHKNGVIGIQ